ncbi:MAG: tyrosine--tRNA ligase, partial [Pseudomonadota bacterium]
MAHFKSDLLQTLDGRGYIHQGTDLEGLDEKARGDPVTAYIGFDCTADSLHVGSLVQIMMLRILQKTGHKPIVLMGGGTTKVGDPSGKDESRQLMTEEQIARNMEGIKSVFDK